MRPRAGLARALLAAVVLLPWIAFGWRYATETQAEPAPPRPAWVHLVVVTAGRVEGDAPSAVDAPAEPAALRALAERSVHVARARSPAASTAAAAASLWTGRWPLHHGVTSNESALAPATWTLAAAARASGAHTAAFLGEPFVAATGIEGFETVRADASYDVSELGRAAERFLSDHPGRFVLWLHVAAAGVDELAELAAALEGALRADGRLLDTAMLVTAFGRRPAASEVGASPVAPFEVPLWLAMPSRSWAGRRGHGTLALVDVTDPLRVVLALPPPAAGAPELQSRAPVAGILRGGEAHPQHLWISAEGYVYDDPAGRASGAGPPPGTLEGADFEAVPEESRELLVRRYGRFVERVTAGATAARPAPKIAGFPGFGP